MPRVSDLIKNALLELGAYSQGEVVSADDADFCGGKLNRVLDGWNARESFVYNVNFVQYLLTANLSPHTIGPGGNFVVAQRPVKIVNANIVLTNSVPNVFTPLNIRDDDWWSGNRVRDLKSSLPTDLYYSPDWPKGSIYLWPVPNTAWKLDLETWNTLAQFVNLTDVLSMPPGYEDALTLTLAENLAVPFKTPLDPLLIKNAQAARDRIQTLNSVAPRISTNDAGMPTRGNKKTYFNYLTGSSSGSGR